MKSLETYTVGDLILERQGHTVTKVTKNGVVLWPQEGHTAPMLLTKYQEQAKEAAMMQQEWELAKQQVGANDRQEGGSHYQRLDATGTCPKCGSAVQHWDWAHNLRGLEYAATKYIARWRDKGGLESLKKAIHYIQKLIEIHFTNVVVTVSYSNRIAEQSGGSSGQYSKGEQYSKELRKPRGPEAQGSPGLAGSSASHPAAVNYEGPYSDTF